MDARTVETAALSKTTMLVSLRVSAWGGRKLDKVVTRAAAKEFHADSAKAGRYNKMLVAPAFLAKVTAAASTLRTTHYKLTLPWSEGGARILSSTAFWQYQTEMTTAIATFENEAMALDGAPYQRAIDQARVDLGNMFNASEYPGYLRPLYAAETRVMPFPDARDFRVEGLAAESIAAVRQSIQRQADEVVSIARREVAERVADVARRIVDRLTVYKVDGSGKVSNPFRDSLLSNAADLLNILPLLNVAADPTIFDVSQRLSALVAGTDVESLRASEAERATVARQAEEILSHVGGFLG